MASNRSSGNWFSMETLRGAWSGIWVMCSGCLTVFDPPTIPCRASGPGSPGPVGQPLRSCQPLGLGAPAPLPGSWRGHGPRAVKGKGAIPQGLAPAIGPGGVSAGALGERLPFPGENPGQPGKTGQHSVADQWAPQGKHCQWMGRQPLAPLVLAFASPLATGFYHRRLRKSQPPSQP